MDLDLKKVGSLELVQERSQEEQQTASSLPVQRSDLPGFTLDNDVLLTITMDKREASAPKHGRSIPIES